jgi:ATP-dependent protease ClpP protease subunit
MENNNALDIVRLGGKNAFTNKSVAQLHDFYLVGRIGPAEEYLDWFETIRQAGENDVVKIHINSIGGDLFTAIQFLRALNDCRGSVITSVEGACMSAATLVYLCADSFEVSPHSMFMFHNYSSGCFGKGGEMFDQITHEKAWAEKIMRQEYRHFLKPKEIDKVLDGKDLWMDGEEVSKRLIKRAKAWQKLDKKAQKKGDNVYVEEVLTRNK